MTKAMMFALVCAAAIAGCGGGGAGGALPVTQQTPGTTPTAGPTASPTPGSYLNGQATISRYMGTVDPAVTKVEGCDMAQGVATQAKSGLVVLDYGEPYTDGTNWGTSDYGAGNPFVTTAQITAAVEGYVDGYAQCNLPETNALTLAVGTSNYGSYVVAAHAQAWEAMVAAIGTYVTGKSYANITVVAANDMETGWGSPTVTRAWLNAYVAASNAIPLYDYGDAGGCPSSSYLDGGTCGGAWTQLDVAYVGGGAGPNVRALPEIYNTSGATAKQWGWIGSGAAGDLHPITFAAVMTQVGSCGSGCSGLDNTPAAALGLMNGQLASHAETSSQVVSLATDITTAN
jgi:hypothetical protein